MKLVHWESVRGKAKGTDTLENFKKWSNLPGVKGTYRIVKTFEQTQQSPPPEAVEPQPEKKKKTEPAPKEE